MQQDDTILKNLFDIVRLNNNEETAEGNSQYMIYTNGLLICQFQDPLSGPDSDNIDSIIQIMLLYALRGQILNLAYSLPASGHLSVAKTRK